MTDEIDIDEVSTFLIKHSQDKQKYEENRDLLFAYINQQVASDPELLDEIQVEAETVEAAELEYPRYRVIKSSDDGWHTLQRRPETVGGQVTNLELGYTIGRTEPEPKMVLDLELFKEEYPDYAALVIDRTYQVDGDLVDEILEDVPELEDSFELVSEKVNQKLVDELAGTDPLIINAIDSCSHPVLSAPKFSPPKKVDPDE